jgi:iron complex outermembrane receptor protein
MNAPTPPISCFGRAPARVGRWAFWLFGLFLGLGLLRAAEAPRRTFDIPAGSAESTLQAFSQQAAGQFIFSAGKVGDAPTRAVKGVYTAREALDQMLAGTDLYAVQDDRTGALTVGRGSTSAVPSAATSGAPGTIIGRIFNPAAGEYIRNAQIRIVETGDTAISENEGAFRLSPVAPGRVTLSVTYTGYRTLTATVDVTSGSTAIKNFELVSTQQDPATTNPDGTVKLQTFVVATEREGAAKAIMDQRKSMNITNTVASDTFGENAEGNIGEFLRNMPGVELDLFYGEVRNVRLGGLGSEYTSVTMDGIALASADANAGGAANARAFTFEMASLASMDSIEVSKTVSADVEANAPAGTINLRTKRAFNTASRRVGFQANLALHSEEFTLKQTPGPNDSGRSFKARPGGMFEFMDSFFDKRLGIVFNISESNVYQETLISTLTYNRTSTAADPRREVITTLNFQHAPRFNKRFATTLTTDFKVNPYLAVGTDVVYNWTELWTPQRIVIFNTGGRTTVVGSDPITSFTTTTGANVMTNPVAVSKMGETLSVVPKFWYKKGDFELEGKFAYSDATSWYDPLVRREAVRDINSPTASGVNFRATRSSPQDTDWQITQISGPDISQGSSFNYAAGTASVTVNDGRFSRSDLISGELNATYRTTRFLPVIWKTGVKERYELRKFSDDQLTRRMDYLGTGTTPIIAGTWNGYSSAYPYDFGITNGSIASISGQNVFMPDLSRIAQLYREQPSRFRQNLSPANYFTAYFDKPRRYEEEIKAGFFMADTKVFKRLKLRAGVRWEGTETDSTEFDPRTPAEVIAAGYPVSAGRATTIPGLQYQYFSKPKIHRTGSYDNFFPSASLKYTILPNLDFSFGYSSTIKRGSYNALTGIFSVDEVAQLVTIGNPNLKPERVRAYVPRLAYYFEPVGQLAVTLYQYNVKDQQLTSTLTSDEYGNTDPLYSGYFFRTTYTLPQPLRRRGMEVEFSRSLTFLPRAFGNLFFRAAYSRYYAPVITPTIRPHSVSSGLTYSRRGFSTNINYTWGDNVPTSNTGLSYVRHRSNLDAGASLRLSHHYRLLISARNLLNTPYINMQWVAPSAPVWTRNETTGTSWTFAVKGDY